MATQAGTDPWGRQGHAQDYVAYRPTYPQALLDAVGKGLPKERLHTLVDVCCGSGQVLSTIAHCFEQAYGFDKSKAQLSCAIQVPNAQYKQADALAIPLPDQSVDVLTIGQGLHWLHYDSFFAEVRRLLRPGGRLVVLGYGTPRMQHSGAEQAFSRYRQLLETYWECDRVTLDNAFEGVRFPYGQEQRLQMPDVKTMPLSAFVDFLRTWSPYRSWLAQHPGVPVILDDLHSTLQKELGDGDNPPVIVNFPFFAVVDNHC